jgi:small subunit ribosomal protein S1
MSQENDDRDFAAILAEFEQTNEAATLRRDPSPGDTVRGRILAIGEDAVFVDVGGRSDGILSRAELTDTEGELTAAVGDSVEVLISGRDASSGGLLLRTKGGSAGGSLAGAQAAQELAQAHALGLPVEGVVAEVIKGGVRVNLSGLRAFCPISQLDLGFVEDPAHFVGQRLTFRIRSFTTSERSRQPDIVVSRRDLLAAEQQQRREEALSRLQEGAVLRGTVTSVTSYGAFVDLGGIEGLIHVSELDHERVENPSEVIAVGEEVEVKILSISGLAPATKDEATQNEGPKKREKGPRISLSRKALQQDPWKDVARRFPADTVLTGPIVRIEAFGAFVRLAPGLEGLIHISELARDRRIAHPREVVQLGQEVQAKVLNVDAERRRISLSLAAAVEEVQSSFAAEYSERQEEASGFGSMASFFQKAKKP